MGASDFIIMPSLTEGFGFVAAEASSIGVPVIVTKNTSLTEVVDKRNSILVNQRDSRELTNAITTLVENNEVRNRLSKNKTFQSWKEVANSYEKIYKNILTQRR